MARLELSDPVLAQTVTEIQSGSSTNWAVFGYVPKTNKLQLVGKGSGGLPELLEEMNDGKVLFCYIRFEVSETYKYVYVAWCGEGVTGMQKGNFANHAKDMEIWLKQPGRGFHVQINARNESDLEEKDIVDKINKGKGANFLVAKTSTEDKGPALKQQRESFWGKQKVVDQVHQQQLKQHETEKEKQLLAAREKHAEQISKTASELHKEELARREAELTKNREIAQKLYKEDAARRQQLAEKQRQQIAARQGEGPRTEYGAYSKATAPLPSHNVYTAPVIYNQNATASVSARRSMMAPAGGASVLRSQFEQMAATPSLPQPQVQPKVPQKVQAPPPVSAPPPSKPTPAVVTPPPVSAPPPSKPTPTPTPVAPPPVSAPPPSKPTPAVVTPPPVSAPPPKPAPPVVAPPPVVVPPPVVAPPEEEPPYEEQVDYNQYEQTYEEPPPAEAPYQEETEPAPQEQGYYEDGSGQYYQARALYDYDGEQEGDLSFREGEVINIIDNSDPSGWWEGELNGQQGFFPSNFVELV